jgi:hypothetical protein
MKAFMEAELLAVITTARRRFTDLVLTHCKHGLSPQVYQRYLSMQYHLTKNVQWYFMTVAAHASLAKLRGLRRFLVDFANEEELHYLVAALDLHKMELSVLPIPFDVELWHAYFSKVVQDRPLVRLGAACVLENLSGTENRSAFKELLREPFLSKENTKFLVLHMHETVPHGELVLDAVRHAGLSSSQWADLVEGAKKGAVLYLRMAEWALDAESLGAWASPGAGAEILSCEDRSLLPQAERLAAVAAA